MPVVRSAGIGAGIGADDGGANAGGGDRVIGWGGGGGINVGAVPGACWGCGGSGAVEGGGIAVVILLNRGGWLRIGDEGAGAT